MVEMWSTYAVCHTLMQLPRCLPTCVSLASGRIARASTRAFVQMQIGVTWERLTSIEQKIHWLLHCQTQVPAVSCGYATYMRVWMTTRNAAPMPNAKYIRMYLVTCGLPPATSLASDQFLSQTLPPVCARVSCEILTLSTEYVRFGRDCLEHKYVNTSASAAEQKLNEIVPDSRHSPRP